MILTRALMRYYFGAVYTKMSFGDVKYVHPESVYIAFKIKFTVEKRRRIPKITPSLKDDSPSIEIFSQTRLPDFQTQYIYIYTIEKYILTR